MISTLFDLIVRPPSTSKTTVYVNQVQRNGGIALQVSDDKHRALYWAHGKTPAHRESVLAELLQAHNPDSRVIRLINPEIDRT